MNFRNTAILFGCVFAVGIGLFILSFTDDKTPTKELLLSGLSGVKASEVDTIELEKGSTRLVLKKVGDNWTIAEPIATRVEPASMDRLVDSLLSLRAIPHGELSANPSVHGLETPSLRVTLRANEKSDTLNIGDVTSGGAKSVGFVTTSARKRPMAVSRSEIEPLFKDTKAGSAGELAKWTNDYRVKQVFDLDSRTGADDVSSIKLTYKKKDLALAKNAAGTWQFTDPAGWGDAALVGDLSNINPSAITGVRGLLNTIINLQAGGGDDFLDHKDPKEFGLTADNPDLIRVEIKDKSGKTEVALMAKKADAPPAPPVPGGPIPPAPPAKLYVKIEGSNAVVRVNPPPTLDGLLAAIANPDPLRDRDLVKDTDKNRIDAIDLTVGGQVTKLRKAGGPFGEWKLYGGPNDPQIANPEVVRKLLDLVAKPGIVKDFPPSSDANFTPAETRAEIKLWMDGVKPNADPKADPAKAEPKVEGPPIVLQFGKKDAEGIFVRRTQANGAKNDSRVPDKVKVAGAPPPQASPFDPPKPAAGDESVDVLATLVRSRLDFLDPSLKGFSQFQANKLTIQNGPNVTEIVKEVPKDKLQGEPKWKYILPAPMKDRTADARTADEILQVIATANMAKYVSEAPSDADLAKWGLDPKNPKMKVTIGLETGPAPPPESDKKDKPDSQRVWYFGNETEDKSYVYARQDGKPGVFTVIKVIADRMATADFRDRTLVRLDPAKVKKIALKGWKDKTGFEVELAFEKKDGTWVVTKSPGAYMVDAAKVDKFLDTINSLRARAFVPGAPKPEQKLIPGEGGLQVNIEVEGTPGIVLFIGGPTDGDSSTFLQTSTLPANDNIATVPSDAFKAYKDNSGSFAK